jgi:heat shock protein HslJ
VRSRTVHRGLLALLAALLLAAGCAPQMPGAPQPPSVQPPLDGTEWALESLGGPDNLKPALANREVTLSLTSDAEVSGNAGCNSYGGSYECGVDGTLRFTDLLHTEMYCIEPGVMDQEQEFLDALATAEQYEIVDGKLRISGGGKLLVLSRA